MRSLVIFLLFLSLSSSVIAASYQGTCSITFQGSSTLHDFEGKDSCQPFIVNEKDGVLGVPELAVAVSGMDTDNSRRDKKMHAMFEVEAFPLILGWTEQVDLERLRDSLKEGNTSTGEIVFTL